MREELVVDAPGRDAWAVIGDGFGDIADWASAITKSSTDGPSGIGQVRTCHLAGFGPIAPGVIRERLLAFDAAARTLSYEAAAGLPKFIVRAGSTWSVHDRDEGTCLVEVDAHLTLRSAAGPLAPVLRWRLRADARRTLAELRHRIETGGPHPRKLATLGRQGAAS